jgi:LAS superfamily LD-carboxypeptidase LdcB
MLQAWMAPPAPAPAVPPAPATSFAATLAQATAAPATGSYPHLTGDLDASPELLQRLEGLAAQRGEKWKITSGLRTVAEQQVLWDNRHSNPFPVARPGTSNHQHGNAADVTINGRPIQDVVAAAELLRAGIRPLAGDAVHVELAS